MFSLVTADGVHAVVSLTATDRVVMRLTHLQRIYTLDISSTAWGQMLLGSPLNIAGLTEQMNGIGRFWSGVNNHFVTLDAGNQYFVACPKAKQFRARCVKLAGTTEERSAIQLLTCPQCSADVTIPDYERSRYAQGNRMKVPQWKAMAATV